LVCAPDASRERGGWTLAESPGWVWIAFPWAEATIDLRQLEGHRMSVATDRAFTPELEDAGQFRSHRALPGRWVVKIDKLPLFSDIDSAALAGST
jgi:hypothetical protein